MKRNELTTHLGKKKLNGLITLYWYGDINSKWHTMGLLT